MIQKSTVFCTFVVGISTKKCVHFLSILSFSAVKYYSILYYLYYTILSILYYSILY
nr:MAG TPA: hypothetical protein [Caudoviricetes sp.]